MDRLKYIPSSLAETNRRAGVGLTEDATEQEVRAAYDKLAETTRRASVGLTEDATEQEVKAAYDKLAEANRRASVGLTDTAMGSNLEGMVAPQERRENLSTPEQAVSLMESSNSAEEWNANVEKVKKAHNGYPDWWFEKIVMSGVANKTRAKWNN